MRSNSSCFLLPPQKIFLSKKSASSPNQTCIVSRSNAPVSPPVLAKTPLSQIVFRNRTVFVKRDDLLSESNISGSKLRKFYSLLPPAVLHPHDMFISYGGAQSNAMASLAALAHLRGIPFAYITRPLPPGLSTTPSNFSRALELGMTHVTLSTAGFNAIFKDLSVHTAEASAREAVFEVHPHLSCHRPLFIPRGGAWPGAEPGVALLAAELREQIRELREKGDLALRKPVIFLAAGTGTTAFFLNKHLADIASVVAIPVSGDERYCLKQMRELHLISRNMAGEKDGIAAGSFPSVLRPRLGGAFADVRPEKLSLWRELCRAAKGLFSFDLIYAPKAWEEVFLAVQENRLARNGEDLIYYHSGGVEGNGSMLRTFILTFSTRFLALLVEIVMHPL